MKTRLLRKLRKKASLIFQVKMIGYPHKLPYPQYKVVYNNMIDRSTNKSAEEFFWTEKEAVDYCINIRREYILSKVHNEYKKKYKEIVIF